MNHKLAATAVQAVRAKWAERLPGLCARFSRQVCWHAYPERKNFPPAGLTAWQQYLWFEAGGYAIDLERGSVPGDILYKKPTEGQPEGHVGIRVPGNKVAENSTYHARRQNGEARGYRTLEQFGKVDGIIRLPE